MKGDLRKNKRMAGFATIFTSLLVGMSFAVVNSTYAASESKNVVEVKADVVNQIVHAKVLVFPIAVKEAVVKEKVGKSDAKVFANRNVFIRRPFFARNPFFFDEVFEEFD